MAETSEPTTATAMIIATTPAPLAYYCYICQDEVDVDHVRDNLKCPGCQTGFLEEIVPGSGSPVPLPRCLQEDPNMKPIVEGQEPYDYSEYEDTRFVRLYGRVCYMMTRFARDSDPEIRSRLVFRSHVGNYVWGPSCVHYWIISTMTSLDFRTTEEKLKDIPHILIRRKQIADKLECPICFEEFVFHEKPKRLRCSHIFHEDCIKTWMCSKGMSCPVCRGHITKVYKSAPESPVLGALIQTIRNTLLNSDDESDSSDDTDFSAADYSDDSDDSDFSERSAFTSTTSSIFSTATKFMANLFCTLLAIIIGWILTLFFM